MATPPRIASWKLCLIFYPEALALIQEPNRIQVWVDHNKSRIHITSHSSPTLSFLFSFYVVAPIYVIIIFTLVNVPSAVAVTMENTLLSL
jgi:hypothetical protein